MITPAATFVSVVAALVAVALALHERHLRKIEQQKLDTITRAYKAELNRSFGPISYKVSESWAERELRNAGLERINR